MAYRKKRRGGFKKRRGRSRNSMKRPKNIYAKRIGRRYGG